MAIGSKFIKPREFDIAICGVRSTPQMAKNGKNRLAGGDTTTMMKPFVVGEEERVLGGQVVGKDADEIIQGMALVITMGGCKKDLDNAMAMHPTDAEEFMTMRV